MHPLWKTVVLPPCDAQRIGPLPPPQEHGRLGQLNGGNALPRVSRSGFLNFHRSNCFVLVKYEGQALAAPTRPCTIEDCVLTSFLTFSLDVLQDPQNLLLCGNAILRIQAATLTMPLGPQQDDRVVLVDVRAQLVGRPSKGGHIPEGA